MAKICFRDMKNINKEIVNEHQQVDATYTVFELKGKRYFQIDTYGKPNRKYTGKISQSIQLDVDSIRDLVAFLIQKFL